MADVGECQYTRHNSTNFQSVYARKTRRIKTHVPDRDQKNHWVRGGRPGLDLQ
jgi:hypothetical protein